MFYLEITAHDEYSKEQHWFTAELIDIVIFDRSSNLYVNYYSIILPTNNINSINGTWDDTESVISVQMKRRE